MRSRGCLCVGLEGSWVLPRWNSENISSLCLTLYCLTVLLCVYHNLPTRLKTPWNTGTLRNREMCETQQLTWFLVNSRCFTQITMDGTKVFRESLNMKWRWCSWEWVGSGAKKKPWSFPASFFIALIARELCWNWHRCRDSGVAPESVSLRTRRPAPVWLCVLGEHSSVQVPCLRCSASFVGWWAPMAEGYSGGETKTTTEKEQWLLYHPCRLMLIWDVC